MGLKGLELQQSAREIGEKLSELARLWGKVEEPFVEARGAPLQHAEAVRADDPRALDRFAARLDGVAEQAGEKLETRGASPPASAALVARRSVARLVDAVPCDARGEGPPSDRIARFSRPMSLHVTSEIGKLKSVLVHLPGPEIDRMVPAMMEELLFDDILYGSRAREEHRRFQQVLGFVADEVLDVQQLLEEVLAVPEQRAAILEDLGRTLSWGPDMDYRLQDLTAGGARLRAGDRHREAAPGDGPVDGRSLLPAAGAELLLPARSAGRGRQPRDPRLDGDAGPAAGAAALRLRLSVPPALRDRRRPVLVPGVLRRLRARPVVRADAADARGRRHPRAARGHARDRLLGADREDDDRAAGGVVQGSRSRRSSGSSSWRSLRRAPTCTSTPSSR